MKISKKAKEIHPGGNWLALCSLIDARAANAARVSEMCINECQSFKRGLYEIRSIDAYETKGSVQKVPLSDRKFPGMARCLDRHFEPIGSPSLERALRGSSHSPESICI